MNEFTSARNLNTLLKEDRIAFGIPTKRCDYIYYNECLSFSTLHCKKGFYLGERLKKGHGSLGGRKMDATHEYATKFRSTVRYLDFNHVNITRFD